MIKALLISITLHTMTKPKFTFILLLLTVRLASQISITIPAQVCTGSVIPALANTATLSVLSFVWSTNPTGPNITAALSGAPGITFYSAGTYSVIVNALTSAGTVSAISVVSVVATPTLFFSAPSYTSCQGVPAGLLASGAATYSWSPASSLASSVGASVTANPSISTVYTVTGTTGNCVSSGTTMVHVTNYPMLTLVRSATAACAGSSITASAYGAVSFTWLPSGFTQSLVNIGVGTHTLIGANGNPACSSYVAFVIPTDACTGIFQNTEVARLVKLYPNPSEGIINLENLSGEALTVEVVDLACRMYMRSIELSQSTKPFTIELPSGFYIVRVKEPDGHYHSLKIIIR